jgi:hypothetical protein
LQPVCPHEQSMSGVFSIASHRVLQYLPDVVTHEQTGCAHFSAFVVAISFLLASDRQRVIQEGILNTREKRFCPIRDISELLVAAWSRGHLGGAATPAEVPSFSYYLVSTIYAVPSLPRNNTLRRTECNFVQANSAASHKPK